MPLQGKSLQTVPIPFSFFVVSRLKGVWCQTFKTRLDVKLSGRKKGQETTFFRNDRSSNLVLPPTLHFIFYHVYSYQSDCLDQIRKLIKIQEKHRENICWDGVSSWNTTGPLQRLSIWRNLWPKILLEYRPFIWYLDSICFILHDRSISVTFWMMSIFTDNQAWYVYPMWDSSNWI